MKNKEDIKADIAWLVLIIGGTALLFLGVFMGGALINNTFGLLLGAGCGFLMLEGLGTLLKESGWLKEN